MAMTMSGGQLNSLPQLAQLAESDELLSGDVNMSQSPPLTGQVVSHPLL
jgi:hypothetical protein